MSLLFDSPERRPNWIETASPAFLFRMLIEKSVSPKELENKMAGMSLVSMFEVFGVRRRSVARYEAHVTKLDDRPGFIDLFWPHVLIVEQKSHGPDLKAAYEQAGN